MKYVFLLFSVMLFCSNAYSTVITEQFFLTTTIDKNSFFSNAITRFEFKPHALALVYNNNTKTFNEAFSDLIVETDIPKTNTDMFLAIRMTENTTQCSDFDNLVISNSDDLAIIHLEDELMSLDQPVDFQFNDVVNDSKAAKYKTSINFKSLPENAIDCSGSVTMTLEFSI
ncbi:hypothetical protein [Vibrio sp. MA40-2]|uniref:hypothetical protein n=1 Tax=Vibrio sp. MA40-2 TaxID=3391828 RepID=UPI0039A70C28